LSLDDKLSQEYSNQKLLKSDNPSSRYSRKCRGCFFGTQCSSIIGPRLHSVNAAVERYQSIEYGNSAHENDGCSNLALRIAATRCRYRQLIEIRHHPI